MPGSLPLEYWYVSALGVSLAVLAATAYAVYTHSGGHHRSVFVGFVAAECAWVLATILQFLVRSPAGKYGLLLTAGMFSVVTIVSVG